VIVARTPAAALLTEVQMVQQATVQSQPHRSAKKEILAVLLLLGAFAGNVVSESGSLRWPLSRPHWHWLVWRVDDGKQPSSIIEIV
jgi:hypothetical protein